jgi:exodeoxyribonuclease VII small subunit
MTKTSKPEHPSFEKALTELEQIVDKLEKGGQSLNESLALFEKGVKLARFLRDELDRAEKKVEILLKDEKGTLKRKPFKLGEEAPEENEFPEDDADEETEASPEEGEDDDSPGKDGGDLPF